MPDPKKHDSREDFFVDIDRMVNEGLGGGQVTIDNGLIEEATADSFTYPESVIDKTDAEEDNKK